VKTSKIFDTRQRGEIKEGRMLTNAEKNRRRRKTRINNGKTSKEKRESRT
jgi:hypothetical protein